MVKVESVFMPTARILLYLSLILLLFACNLDTTLQSGDPTDFKQAVLIDKYGITSISIFGKNDILKIGSTQQYTASGKTATGDTIDISDAVRWSVSNSTAADISETGLLTGKSPDSITVTATLSTYTATANLRITNATVETISISESDGSTGFQVDACKPLQLKAMATYSGESFTADVTDQVTWSTGTLSADIARFSALSSEPGLLLTSAVNNNISVSASLEGVNATATIITVDGFSTAAAGTAITLDPSSVVINDSSSVKQMAASASFDDGSSAEITRSAVWSSNNDAVASVDNSSSNKGLVSAHTVGNATITAKCGSQRQTAEVQVTSPALTSLSIDYDQSTVQSTDAGGSIVYLLVGDRLQLNATAHYADNTSSTVTTSATWETTVFPGAPPNTLTIASDGLVTTNAAGSVLVKATYNNQAQTLNIIVQ